METITILVLESDEKSRRSIRNLLNLDGYRVIETSHVADALTCARTELPDLILMAVPAFGMNGLDDVRQFADDPKLGRIPLVVLTYCAMKGDEEKVRAAGCSGIICKPIDPERFLNTISGFFQLGHKRVAAERKGAPAMILVVTDSDATWKLARRLSSRKINLRRVSAHEEAAALVSRGGLDVVLVDHSSSGKDAVSLCLCKQIKPSERNRNVQVLMALDFGDTGARVKGLELGADDFIVSPMTLRELRDRIQALLVKKSRLDRMDPPLDKALENVLRDPVSGLYNATYFRHFLSYEVRRHRRRREAVSLLLLGIDNLADITVAYGESAGDDVLKELGQLVQDSTRETDVSARLRQGEIGVVLPASDSEGVGRVARRIHYFVAGHTFATGLSFFGKKISVSMGTASYPSEAGSLSRLIRTADERLDKQRRCGGTGDPVKGGLPI